MRDVLLAFGSSLAVLWPFGAYEIVHHIRSGVAFNLRPAFLARWSTPGVHHVHRGGFCGRDPA